MNRRFVLAIILPIVLLGLLGVAFRAQRVEASGTIYIRADGSVDPPTAPISSLDNVTYTFTDDMNDSVYVERDNIVVDGAGYTLQGAGIGTGMALTIGRSNVTIKNVEIKGFGLGIKLYEASNNTISGNSILVNSWYGIHIDGSSNENNISENNITNNNNYGICLEASSNNFLHGNLLEGNQYGFCVLGDELNHYLHSIDTSNLVNGKPVYYLINQHGITINASTHPTVGFQALINSTDNTAEGLTLTKNAAGLLVAYTNSTKIQGNNISDNKDGIYVYVSSNNTISGNNIAANHEISINLYQSSDNTISGNSIGENDYGIYLDYSSNNTISGNNITKNNIGIYLYDSSNITISGNSMVSNDCGIFFEGSSNNSIYHNSFISNTVQVDDPGANITWDNGYPSGGNYWSDYTDVDLFSGPYQNETGSDGIWDHPYIIDDYNTDYYPVVPEFSSLFALSLLMIATLLTVIFYRRKLQTA